MFSVKALLLLKNLILPAERRKKQTNNEKKVAKLLTFGGKAIDPTTHIYAVVFDNGVLFFAQCVRECSRLCVRKWGAQRPREGNPYFYSVSWVSEGQQLPQQASQICNVVSGQHAEYEASSKKNSGL